MAAQDRRDAIKHELAERGQVSVSSLSKRLGVTEETIRRDLERFENDGVLKRTYGGAIQIPRKQAADAHFFKRVSEHLDEKRIIARNALPLLRGMSAVAADSSTTAMEAVKLLANRSDMTLLTNSVVAFQELADSKLTVVTPGGEFDKNTLSLRGEATKKALEQYRVDAALFSCKGFDEHGAFDSREGESEIKRMLLKQASKLILLADHTKFKRAAFVKLTDLDRIDYLVTDREPSDEWKSICERHRIELIF